MKRMVTLVLALTVFLGQAPAWALSKDCAAMAQSGLACLRVCAKSEALLTQGGKLASVGAACAKVETRFAQPSLSAVVLPALDPPTADLVAPLGLQGQLQPSFSTIQRAHAPPCDAFLTAVLSVPVAQAPPAFA